MGAVSNASTLYKSMGYTIHTLYFGMQFPFVVGLLEIAAANSPKEGALQYDIYHMYWAAAMV